MKTKVTRRGDRWCFLIEAKVWIKHYEVDSRLEAYDVLGSFADKAEGIFDEALVGTRLSRNGEVDAILSWDKHDPQTAGHPWSEPDPRDDFPGQCPWPTCHERNIPGKTACAEHVKHLCPVCGYLRFLDIGCKCGIEPREKTLLNMERCPHSPSESETDCAACRVLHDDRPTPCDFIAKEEKDSDV